MKVSSNYNIIGLQKQNQRKDPSFKRNWAEHVSWGVNYTKELKKADFKLFAFPDAKMVFVEIAKEASKKFNNIKEFAVGIIAKQTSTFEITGAKPLTNDTNVYKMENKGNGVFEALGLPAEEGAQYRYVVVKNDNKINIVKDPYSKKQPDINGWSEVYDHSNYDWKADLWLEGKDPRRIVRNPQDPMRGLGRLIIEEVNIPTLSNEGTFEKAKAHIDRIAEKGLATAVEFMPVENTYSLQWGYDGVDKFAINEKMGTAAQFKELIDYAHLKGLNVIIDMVPNHVGPDGNYLTETGPYKGHNGKYGDIPNYEGLHNRYVRDWMTNAALWWIKEFKADGLRLDMTKDCKSDYLLKQIVCEVNEHAPLVFMIAEDGRDNKKTVTAYEQYPMKHDVALEMIDQSVDNIANQRWHTYPNAIGFDSEWDFPLMHELYDSVLRTESINLNRLDDTIWNSAYRVKYIMSHDEIGNWDGTRLIPKILVKELNLYNKVNGVDDAEKGQKAAQISQKLSMGMLLGEFSNLTPNELKKKLSELGMARTDNLSYERIERAFNIALAKQKLTFATIMTLPGPKMFFQGDDELDLGHFKFFREFSGEKYDRQRPEYVKGKIADKGYDPFESEARPDSILGKIKIDESNPYKSKYKLFVKHLGSFIKEYNLSTAKLIGTHKNDYHSVHVHHIKTDADEFLVIKNYGNNFHKGTYNFSSFPQGEWKEVLNSDSAQFGGLDYVNDSRKSITANEQKLNLAPNSVSILRKM